MIKLAIFDLDQTLLNTLPRFHRIFNLALKHFKAPEISWEEFISSYEDDTLNKFIPIEPRKFWDYFLEHYNDVECIRDTLIDGASECLSYLKSLGIKIVIITGRMVSRQEVWKELRRFEIDRYVDFVYTRLDNYEDGKKRTELIREAMRKFKVEAHETIFVGDYWPDMESGREAGVFTIGVLTGLESEEKLRAHGADEVIESVKFLPHLIREFETRFGGAFK